MLDPAGMATSPIVGLVAVLCLERSLVLSQYLTGRMVTCLLRKVNKPVRDYSEKTGYVEKYLSRIGGKVVLFNLIGLSLVAFIPKATYSFSNVTVEVTMKQLVMSLLTAIHNVRNSFEESRVLTPNYLAGLASTPQQKLGGIDSTTPLSSQSQKLIL